MDDPALSYYSKNSHDNTEGFSAARTLELTQRFFQEDNPRARIRATGPRSSQLGLKVNPNRPELKVKSVQTESRSELAGTSKSSETNNRLELVKSIESRSELAWTSKSSETNNQLELVKSTQVDRLAKKLNLVGPSVRSN
ncbi:hypothetical protein LR48_Vigan01g282000 [Vigna angularis]|uniref:Uncharacterized protein n=1 Tax=Phaseolus angularis TaxID=3914 RepID=A0A0L9TSW5_PHAAN|nr:hypothetical protein LR48_Vigan01g282000 [Vigna angularis]